MNNKLPKLSVLIPTYNREDYVGMAIDSVLNQEFSDLEIICSDNASTDSTFQILEKYKINDNRIKVFRNDENLGPVPNWKKCLENASGEYVHWLWSDDWIEPNFYVDAFNQMQLDGTKVLSTWNYRSDNPIDVNDRYISWQFSFNYVPGPIAARKVLFLKGELPVSPAAYILPRELVCKHFYTNIPKVTERIDPVNKGVGVDSLMIVGCCNDVGAISVLQKPSVTFRKHDNLSVQFAEDGSLQKMYLLSHLWFLSEKRLCFGLIDTISFLRKANRALGKMIPRKCLVKTTFRALTDFLRRRNKILTDKLYVSKKAFLK